MGVANKLYTLYTHRKLLVQGLLLLILIFLATFPRYGSSSAVYILAGVLMYVILTASWVMFSGSTGYLSLAVAAFFGIGQYTAAFLYPRTGALLPLPAVIVIGGLVSACIALIFGLVTLRLKGVYFIIFTFGFVMLLYSLTSFWEGQIIGVRGQRLVPISNETTYYAMLAIVVATLLTAYFLGRSRLGLAMLSIGENEEAAAHMGVNTTMVKIITFAISTFFMGAAGAVIAPTWVYIDPLISFDAFYSFMPVLMAVFGGMGQLYGPVIGAVIFAYLEYYLRINLANYYMLTFGIILVIIILFVPSGMAGLITTLRNRLGGVITKLWKGGEAEQHANT
jgi:branched-chain amino acid transport system permease protein